MTEPTLINPDHVLLLMMFSLIGGYITGRIDEYRRKRDG